MISVFSVIGHSSSFRISPRFQPILCNIESHIDVFQHGYHLRSVVSMFVSVNWTGLLFCQLIIIFAYRAPLFISGFGSHLGRTFTEIESVIICTGAALQASSFTIAQLVVGRRVHNIPSACNIFSLVHTYCSWLWSRDDYFIGPSERELYFPNLRPTVICLCRPGKSKCLLYAFAVLSCVHLRSS
jgi:hypothetical protein